MKKCTICKRLKPLAEFCKNKAHADGLNAKCRDCGKALWAKYRKERPESVAASQRKSRLKNIDEIKRRKAIHVRKPQSRFNEAKRSSRARGLKWAIAFEEFALHLLDVCRYCEGPLSETGHGYDRIDNLGHYELANVVPCCTTCNMLRSALLSHSEMLQLSANLKAFRLARSATGGVW